MMQISENTIKKLAGSAHPARGSTVQQRGLSLDRLNSFRIPDEKLDDLTELKPVVLKIYLVVAAAGSKGITIYALRSRVSKFGNLCDLETLVRKKLIYQNSDDFRYRVVGSSR